MVTACAELDSHSSVSRFQNSEDTYREGMHWEEWEKVLYLTRTKAENDLATDKATQMNPHTGKEYEVINANNEEKKREFEELIEHLETIKVLRTEVLSSSMNDDAGTGATRLLIEYRFNNSTKIQTIRQRLSWWHDEKINIWFTETPLPEEFTPPKKKTIKLSPQY